ncbi:MAG: hypothetical protein ACI9HK_000156 [Pirellulaceae bacterium]|jgi:hypothetical protein
MKVTINERGISGESRSPGSYVSYATARLVWFARIGTTVQDPNTTLANASSQCSTRVPAMLMNRSIEPTLILAATLGADSFAFSADKPNLVLILSGDQARTDYGSWGIQRSERRVSTREVWCSIAATWHHHFVVRHWLRWWPVSIRMVMESRGMM